MESTYEARRTSRDEQSIALLTQLNRDLFGESVTIIDATGTAPDEVNRPGDTQQAA